METYRNFLMRRAGLGYRFSQFQLARWAQYIEEERAAKEAERVKATTEILESRNNPEVPC